MRAEAENPVPHPAGLASFDAAQDKVGFLGWKYTQLAYIQFLIHQYLLPSASLQTTLNQSFMQSTLKMAALGTDQTHVGSHTWPCWSSWEKKKKQNKDGLENSQIILESVTLPPRETLDRMCPGQLCKQMTLYITNKAVPMHSGSPGTFSPVVLWLVWSLFHKLVWTDLPLYFLCLYSTLYS